MTPSRLERASLHGLFRRCHGGHHGAGAQEGDGVLLIVPVHVEDGAESLVGGGEGGQKPGREGVRIDGDGDRMGCLLLAVLAELPAKVGAE